MLIPVTIEKGKESIAFDDLPLSRFSELEKTNGQTYCAIQKPTGFKPGQNEKMTGTIENHPVIFRS
jgi:hypothetical protein